MTFGDKAATLLLSHLQPDHSRRNGHIQIALNFVFESVVANISFGDGFHCLFGLKVDVQFGGVESVGEQLVVHSQDFSPDLLNVFVGETFDKTEHGQRAFQNVVTTVAGLIDEKIIVVGGDGEHAMAQIRSREFIVRGAIVVGTAFNERLDGVNFDVAQARHLLEFAAPSIAQGVNGVKIVDVGEHGIVPTTEEPFENVAFADLLIALQYQNILVSATGIEYASDGGEQPFGGDFAGIRRVGDFQEVDKQRCGAICAVPSGQVREHFLNRVEGMFVAVGDDIVFD